MIDLDETIVAPATASGEAAIAIVRLSGARAAAIVDRFVEIPRHSSVSEMPVRRLVSCVIRRGEEIVDHAMCVRFAAPASYSGQEMVELHLHGNPVIVHIVVELAVKHGARLAAPGEFSRRAFVNGKLDLTQIEGLASVLKSESERSLVYAQRQLHGDLARLFGEIRAQLRRLLGLLELELDFAEDGYVLTARHDVVAVVEHLQREVERLLASFRSGEKLRRGPRILLMGLPNAGKSSLFNALVGFSRALVSPVAGTTRDYVEEKVEYRGSVFHFLDTAGVRETVDETEAAGIRLSEDLVPLVDHVLFLIDSASDCASSELALSEFRSRYPAVVFTALYTKTDLRSAPEHELGCSVLDGESIERLLAFLWREVGMDVSDSLLLLSRRQFDLLSELHLLLCEGQWDRSDAELLSYDLRNVLAPLDRLSGAVTSSEVLDEIFAAFCIGK